MFAGTLEGRVPINRPSQDNHESVNVEAGPQSIKQLMLKEELRMQLQPLGDRVVVKAGDDAETRTPSGLVIPDTAKEKPQMGEVVAVGPGARDDDGARIPMEVSVGDKVLYSKFAGTEVKLDSDDYLVLSERDLLAIVN